MCGISGFLNRDREHPADEALLKRMTEVIAHRGPDGSGHFCQGPVALGHRRLSIIDLSENGAQQPAVTSDGLQRILSLYGVTACAASAAS